MESLSDRLRAYYGLSLEEYERFKEQPSFKRIPTIEGDVEVQKAIKRLKEAKEKGEKVIVYGDYDTDGVMSASIMTRLLADDGIKVEGYLPSRYLDGYGITLDNVRKIAAKGYSLIITTDNGVKAYEAIAEAKRSGVDVIVLDHHEFGDEDPAADIIIHPDRLSYGETPISAGYLCFLFSVAYRQEVDPYFLSLGAISTISDMMPLCGYNREIVRLLLKIANERHFPEIDMLCETKPIDMDELKLGVIPKINAIGRMEKGTSINRLLRYFASRSLEGKGAAASWISAVNEERKALTKQAVGMLEVSKEEAAIVTISDLPEGLNGLLASRLLQSEGKPVAVFSAKENDPTILVGSLRSQDGFDVLKALKTISVPLLSHGGHAFAGGCTIAKSDFASFKKDFAFFALKHPLSEKKEERVEIRLEECSMKGYETIQSFGPFGFGHEAPPLALYGLDPSTFLYIRDGKYLSTPLGNNVRLFSFRLGKEAFEGRKKVDLSVSLRLNPYKGRVNLDVMAEGIL